MLVIAILGILATLIFGNLIMSLAKGRDAARKSDLEQIQKAIEMYYEDKKAYPSTITSGSSLTDPVSGKIYMQKVPSDPSSYFYRYCVSNAYDQYQIYSTLENTQDPRIITPVPAGTCNRDDCGAGTACKYGVSSPNTTP